jgi:DNA-binding response OmpR family regulator
MKILLADDDPATLRLVQAALTKWGYEVIAVTDGGRAADILLSPDAPKLAILDWKMPVMDGPSICRRVREQETSEPAHIILLTSCDLKSDVVEGLQSGANDYVTKPFDRAELESRVRVGRRVVELQHALAARVRELEAALAEVSQLRELLPICSYCKKVRDDDNYWTQVEDYLLSHVRIQFSHGICPDCWQTHAAPMMDASAPLDACAEAIE